MTEQQMKLLKKYIRLYVSQNKDCFFKNGKAKKTKIKQLNDYYRQTITGKKLDKLLSILTKGGDHVRNAEVWQIYNKIMIDAIKGR